MNRLKDEVDEPETIVDRLRGIYVNKVGEYPSAEPPYKTSPIMQEAARRIEESTTLLACYVPSATGTEKQLTP